MTHPSEQDVIGARPAKAPADLGPLFTGAADVAAAEAEIRRDFVEPGPAPRAREETQAFVPVERPAHQDAVERIQRECEGPLLELALQRRDTADEELIGVTAEDVRAIADRKGLTPLLGPNQRAWSWLSSWLGQLARRAQLVKYRRAGMTVKRMSDHGNEQTVYLHPNDHRARTAA